MGLYGCFAASNETSSSECFTSPYRNGFHLVASRTEPITSTSRGQFDWRTFPCCSTSKRGSATSTCTRESLLPFSLAPMSSVVVHRADGVTQARLIEGNLSTAVHFSQHAIITVSRAALVKFWERPPRTGPTNNRERAGRVREGRERERELRNPREREGLVMA